MTMADFGIFGRSKPASRLRVGADVRCTVDAHRLGLTGRDQQQRDRPVATMF
jgi:hypothetical protein